eukprot:scaffold126_cov142-Skeletonema_marinoi.AAC.1
MSSSKAKRISLSPPSTNPSSTSSNDRSSRQLKKVSYKNDDNDDESASSNPSSTNTKEDDNDYYDDDDDDDESLSREAPTTKKKKKKKNSKKKNIPTTEPNFPPPSPLPSRFELRTSEEAIGKSDEFVRRTEKFIKHHYNKFNGHIKPLAKEFTRYMWPIISRLCTEDDTGNSCFPVDGMVSPGSELLGIYILWLHENNYWKAGCVTGKSRDLITRTAEQIDPQWDVAKYALIAMTLPKLRELADNNRMIWEYVDEFINVAESFNVYEDHEEDNKEEVLIFLMEHAISCCLKGVDPGYILERFIKNGSPYLTKYLSSCSKRNQTVAEALSILTQANSHCTLIQTWETYAAATRDGMLEVLNKLKLDGCNPESILQLEALMEALFPLLHRKGKYMKRQVGLNYLWNGAVLPIDIIDALYCPIYADVEKLAREVTALMGRIDDDYDGTFDKIRALFETFTLIHKKRYVPPDREGDIYLGAIKKVLADALDSARKSDYTQELIEGEAHMLDLLSDEDRNYYLSGEELSVVNPMGEVAGTLYKTTHGEEVKKTIMIFVTEFSPFAPYQPKVRSFIARARGVSKQLAVADTRAAAGLIQDAAVAKFRYMMSSTLINIEPPKYDYTAAPKLDDDILEEEMFEGEDEEDSEVIFAISGIRKAFPLGYLDVSKSVGIGVAALASIIHPGMIDLHAAALMAAMETHHSRFATFLLKYCQIDITPPDGMDSKEELVQFFQSIFFKSRILWGIEQTRRVVNALPDDPDEEELDNATRAILELEDDKRIKADNVTQLREFCGDEDETRCFSVKYAFEVLQKGADDVLNAKLSTLSKAYELAFYPELVRSKYKGVQGFPGGLARIRDLCDDDFDRF